MADAAEERQTMVHVLREEPGSYTRTLEDGIEVTYQIQPSDGRHVARWQYGAGPSARSSHEEEFSSHAGALT